MRGTRLRNRGGKDGISIVELLASISLIATLMTIAVPAFLVQVRRNKVSEASENLSELHRRTAAYYATERRIKGAPAQRRCLPLAAGPTPSTPSSKVRVVSFFDMAAAGFVTWRSLGFNPPSGVRYAYSYTPQVTGCYLKSGIALKFIAQGDLDGDGTMSKFVRTAYTTAEPYTLSDDPVLFIENRAE